MKEATIIGCGTNKCCQQSVSTVELAALVVVGVDMLLDQVVLDVHKRLLPIYKKHFWIYLVHLFYLLNYTYKFEKC